jgi:16S rRNA C1402 N4-methylase RsmH
MRNKTVINRQLEKVDNQLNQLSSILRQGGEYVVMSYNDKLKEIKETLNDIQTMVNGESDDFQ